MAEKYQNKYRIKSARAAWWNYGNNGMYFITICTANKKHWFGKITDGVMELSEMGEYLNEQILNIQQHYPYAIIDDFVIMPNHLHLIVLINGADCRDGARTVSTENTKPDDKTKRWKNLSVDKKMQKISYNKKALSVVIGGLKSAATRYAHATNPHFAWQTRFHDHIIRSTDDLIRILHYIETNIKNWKSDSFYQNGMFIEQ